MIIVSLSLLHFKIISCISPRLQLYFSLLKAESSSGVGPKSSAFLSVTVARIYTSTYNIRMLLEPL
jgi:hypothetical protein